MSLLESARVPDPERRMDEYPHQLSGGLRQRVCIAVALAAGPQLLFADEPTTALDVTVQAQVLDLLLDLQAERGLGLLLITHDLGIVAELCDRVLVMYGGRIVESGDIHTIFATPRHPYTIGLINSLPKLTEDEEHLEPIPGAPPSLIDVPSGCPFHPRCFLSQGREKCRTDVPALVVADGSHEAACHFSDELVGYESKYSKGAKVA